MFCLYSSRTRRERGAIKSDRNTLPASILGRIFSGEAVFPASENALSMTTAPAPLTMSDPSKPSSLAELRADIDRIDAQMPRLLMEGGAIIGRLIKVKRTSESGSGFRPAREADMMRRLVQRHHGILPLDTAESIWRVIIATFTYVQAPFRVHADLATGEAAMRDSERFHFGFTVPFTAHTGAAGVVAAVAASQGDLGLVPATAGGGGRVGRARAGRGAEDGRAPALGGARRSPRRSPGLRDRAAASGCGRDRRH